MQIAIDTSTDIASLALYRDDKVLAELTWRCEQSHTTQLLPHLSHLLNQSGLNPGSANCIIVARGPGSYNGLRVGISAAKGLAFSLGIPIIAISTLEAIAYQYASSGLPVCPILNAGRGEIATAIFQQTGSEWQRLVVEQITTIDVLCQQLTSGTIICGELAPDILTALSQQLRQKMATPSSAASLRRASFLAELGLKRFKAGDYDNAATLQPLYLRGPSITQPKR